MASAPKEGVFGKTPITALQEYCAKKSLPRPKYDFATADDGSKSFVCIVEALDEVAEGCGRSKKEAKHDASANIIKKLKESYPDIEDIPQAPHEAIPMTDAIADLRDMCIQFDHPLPTFEIVQHVGPPEAPEFTAECRVATIKRFATASTKKGAKQLAAKEILEIIRAIPVEEHQLQIMTLEDSLKNDEETTRKRIKTYREYVDSDIKVVPGTRIADRHNYFKNFPLEIKQNIWAVLKDENFVSAKEKAFTILKELGIKYRESTIPRKSGEPFAFIELLCDFDVVFVDDKNSIYEEMIRYFSVMVN